MGTAAIDATAKGASSNSYVTLAQADQYHDNRVASSTTWGDSSENNKIRAILWATELLESLYDWNGAVTITTQKLAWPRSGLWNRNGYALDEDTLPEPIRDATAEFARQLLVSRRADDNPTEAESLTNLKAGSISLTFDDPYNKIIPDVVYHLIPEMWGTPRGRLRGTLQAMRA
jgi:hypothetical protein